MTKSKDDWHITKHIREWPKIEDISEIRHRIAVCKRERAKGCWRPDIAPCKNEWVVIKFYFRNMSRVYEYKCCLENREHMSYLFSWISDWARYEICDQEGSLINKG